MSNQPPPTIDPVAAQRWCSMPAQAAPWLHEEVARRMEQRLQWIKLQPANWADWEPLRGGVQTHGLLRQRYQGAGCFVIESTLQRSQAAAKILGQPWWSPSRWRRGVTHFGLPPQGGVELLWANMGLHMVAQPQELIAQWHSALTVDGFLMFSCLGPDTLRHLRQLYAAMDWSEMAHAFTDMHDWGDMLVNAGFAEPVMDMERITLSFDSAARLLQELRGLGRNLHSQRFAGLRGRHWRADLERALSEQLVGPDGRLVLEFEVIYGHAFKPQPKLRISPESSVSLAQMRSVLQQGKRFSP